MGAKQYSGQAFVPTTSPEAVAKERAAQVEHDGEGAVSLDVLFSLRGIRDPVMKAAMRAHTTVRRATVEGWNVIFAKF